MKYDDDDDNVFQGAKVPGSESSRVRKFQGAKVPGSESSRVRKFQGAKIPHLELSLPGANGLGSEKSIIQSKLLKVAMKKCFSVFLYSD